MTRFYLSLLLLFVSFKTFSGGILVKGEQQATLSASESSVLSDEPIVPQDFHQVALKDESIIYTLTQTFQNIDFSKEWVLYLPVPSQLSKNIQLKNHNGKEKLKFETLTQAQKNNFLISQYQTNNDIRWLAWESLDVLKISINSKNANGIKVETILSAENLHFPLYTFANTTMGNQSEIEISFKNETSSTIGFYIPEVNNSNFIVKAGEEFSTTLQTNDLSGNLDVFLGKKVFNDKFAAVLKSKQSNHTIININSSTPQEIIPEIVIFLELSESNKQKALALIQQMFAEYFQNPIFKVNFVLNDAKTTMYDSQSGFLKAEDKRKLGEFLNAMQSDLETKNSTSALSQILQQKPVDENGTKILLWINDIGISKYKGKEEQIINSITQSNSSKSLVYPVCIGNLVNIDLMHKIADLNDGRLLSTLDLNFDFVNNLMKEFRSVIIKNLTIFELTKAYIGKTKSQGLIKFKPESYLFDTFSENLTEIRLSMDKDNEKIDFMPFNFYSNSLALKFERSKHTHQALNNSKSQFQQIYLYLMNQPIFKALVKNVIIKSFDKKTLPVYFRTLQKEDIDKNWSLFSEVSSQTLENYLQFIDWQNLKSTTATLTEEDILYKKKMESQTKYSIPKNEKHIGGKTFFKISETEFFVEKDLFFDSKSDVIEMSRKDADFQTLLREKPQLMPYLSVGSRVAFINNGIIYAILE